MLFFSTTSSCSSKLWPQKHLVFGVERPHGTPQLEEEPGELPRSRIWQAPQSHMATNLCFGGLLGASGGGGGGGTCELDLPLRVVAGALDSRRVDAARPSGRPDRPRSRSLARAIAWNRLVASSTFCPGFLSGWKTRARRLYALFTSSLVQPCPRPSTNLAAASGVSLLSAAIGQSEPSVTQLSY